MILEKMPDPFDAIVVRNTYSENELEEIWKELNFLTRDGVLFSPDESNSAMNSEGKLLKKNKSLFLFNTYTNPKISPIINYTAKNIFSHDVFDFYNKINNNHSQFFYSNQHTTMISYYENNDYYDFHKDGSLYSSVTYLFKEPRQFDGGDIVFKINDCEYLQKIENNLSIIFPSFYEHKVEKIEMKNTENSYSGLGRYCISQFAFLGPTT